MSEALQAGAKLRLSMKQSKPQHKDVAKKAVIKQAIVKPEEKKVVRALHLKQAQINLRTLQNPNDVKQEKKKVEAPTPLKSKPVKKLTLASLRSK